MPHRFAEIMFTDAVKRAQQDYGSRQAQERFQTIAGPNDRLTDRETAFIALRDSFYMATVNEDGWPYVQHRGGPPGFLRVLDPTLLGYADYRGNTQLVTMGNSRGNDRASLILVDYPNRRRLKILGHLAYQAADDTSDELRAAVVPGEYQARVERIVLIRLAAFDWNCPQHITPRYTLEELKSLDSDG